MSLHAFSTEQFLPYSLERVFGFFKKPENLNQVTPKNLGFKILTPSPIKMEKGTVIDYTIRLYGVPMHWKTVIAEYDPPHFFTDTQVKGPYQVWIHTHRFVAQNGGTLMIDDLQYAIPLGCLGELARAMFVKKEIERIFEYRKKVIKQIFEEGVA